MPRAKKFYAVAQGYKPGIYRTWPEAEQQVKGFTGAIHKGFQTELEAVNWLASVTAGGDPYAPNAQGAAGSGSTPSTTNSEVTT